MICSLKHTLAGNQLKSQSLIFHFEMAFNFLAFNIGVIFTLNYIRRSHLIYRNSNFSKGFFIVNFLCFIDFLINVESSIIFNNDLRLPYGLGVKNIFLRLLRLQNFNLNSK